MQRFCSFTWLLLTSSSMGFVAGCTEDDEAKPLGVAGLAGAEQVGGANSHVPSGGRASGAGGAGGAGDHDLVGIGGSDGGTTAGESGDAGAGGAAEPELPIAERWLAFRLERPNNKHPLWLSSLPSASLPVLVDADVESFEWSANGERLVYVTSPSGSAANAAYTVEVSSKGLAERRLLHPLLDRQEDRVLNASVSPDGKSVALQLYEDGTTTWYVTDVTSSLEVWSPLGSGALGQHPSQPGRDFAWSPDGRRFAFLDGDASDELILVLLEAGAEAPEESAAVYAGAKILEWSHDGTRLLAEAGAPEQRSLFLFGDGASNMTTLTLPGTYTDLSLAHFSPNDARVAFKARKQDIPALFIASVSKPQPLVEIEPFVGDFRWLPDSETLACWGNNGPHLYAAAADELALAQLNPPQTVVSCQVTPCFQVTNGAILFSSTNEAQTASQLYEARLDSGTPDVRPLTSFAAETLLNTIQSRRMARAFSSVPKWRPRAAAFSSI